MPDITHPLPLPPPSVSVCLSVCVFVYVSELFFTSLRSLIVSWGRRELEAEKREAQRWKEDLQLDREKLAEQIRSAVQRENEGVYTPLVCVCACVL